MLARNSWILIAAMVVLSLASGASEAAARRPNAEEQALLEVEATGQAQVTELSRLSGSLAPGPERDALLRRAAEIKRDTRVSLLRARADFARRRGDILGARAIEDALSALLAPRPVPPAGVRAPTKTAPRDGGQR